MVIVVANRLQSRDLLNLDILIHGCWSVGSYRKSIGNINKMTRVVLTSGICAPPVSGEFITVNASDSTQANIVESVAHIFTHARVWVSDCCHEGISGLETACKRNINFKNVDTYFKKYQIFEIWFYFTKFWIFYLNIEKYLRFLLFIYIFHWHLSAIDCL